MLLFSSSNGSTLEMFFMPANVWRVSGVSADDAFELVEDSYFTRGEPNVKMFL